MQNGPRQLCEAHNYDKIQVNTVFSRFCESTHIAQLKTCQLLDAHRHVSWGLNVLQQPRVVASASPTLRRPRRAPRFRNGTRGRCLDPLRLVRHRALSRASRPCVDSPRSFCTCSGRGRRSCRCPSTRRDLHHCGYQRSGRLHRPDCNSEGGVRRARRRAIPRYPRVAVPFLRRPRPSRSRRREPSRKSPCTPSPPHAPIAPPNYRLDSWSKQRELQQHFLPQREQPQRLRRLPISPARPNALRKTGRTIMRTTIGQIEVCIALQLGRLEELIF